MVDSLPSRGNEVDKVQSSFVLPSTPGFLEEDGVFPEEECDSDGSGDVPEKPRSTRKSAVIGLAWAVVLPAVRVAGSNLAV